MNLFPFGSVSHRKVFNLLLFNKVTSSYLLKWKEKKFCFKKDLLLKGFLVSAFAAGNSTFPFAILVIGKNRRKLNPTNPQPRHWHFNQTLYQFLSWVPIQNMYLLIVTIGNDQYKSSHRMNLTDTLGYLSRAIFFSVESFYAWSYPQNAWNFLLALNKGTLSYHKYHYKISVHWELLSINRLKAGISPPQYEICHLTLVINREWIRKCLGKGGKNIVTCPFFVLEGIKPKQLQFCIDYLNSIASTNIMRKDYRTWKLKMKRHCCVYDIWWTMFTYKGWS